MSDEYKQFLLDDGERYLGVGLKDLLSKFRKEGKDHLCIVPHGALHFYSFHLLPLGNGLIADHWMVTYLPSIKLIEGKRFNVSDQKKTLSLFCLLFSKSPFKFLAPLVNAPVEANKIAAIYGTKVFIDEMATEKVFMTALQDSKRVHIARPGSHNISAPAFQCLYAYPVKKLDGIIHPYMFIVLNLRGLDIVILSACKTALGRIDSAENLRGIPAILLSEGGSHNCWNTLRSWGCILRIVFYHVLYPAKGEYL